MKIKFTTLGILLFAITACNKTVTNEIKQKENNTTTTNGISVTKSTDPKIINNVKQWQSTTFGTLLNIKESLSVQSSNISANTEVDFNYDNLFLVSNVGKSDTVTIARAKNYSETNTVNYEIAFYGKPGSVSKAIIIKLENIADSVKQISYYSTTGVALSSVQIDSKAQSITMINQSSNETKSVLSTNNKKAMSLSSDTLGCIQDAYTNHGWASVGAWVVSGITGWGAALITANCIALNS